MRFSGLSKARVVILGVLGFVALIALAAWLGDLSAISSVRDFHRESVDYFMLFKREGFSKPGYFDDMRTGNAWTWYAPAIVLTESLEADRRFLTDFLNGADPDSGRAATLVMEADSILDLVKAGARHRTALAPLDYEEGLKVQFPNYMALTSVSRLLATRARLRLKSDPDGAIDDMLSGLVFAGDIGGGDLTLIGHMVGNVCLSVCKKQVGAALAELQQEDLRKVAEHIALLEREWPKLSKKLESEHRMASVTLSGIGVDRNGSVGLPGLRGAAEGFWGWWVLHLLSWRQGFSYRRTQLGAMRFGMEMVEDLAVAEEGGWSKVKGRTEEWDTRVRNTNNWLVKLSMPNFQNMLRRNFEARAGIRLVGTGALLGIYRLENGGWPDQLRRAELDELDDLLVDPITAEDFRYLVHAAGDSVSLYSLGTDLEDDGGRADREEGDLVLVLHGQTD